MQRFISFIGHMHTSKEVALLRDEDLKTINNKTCLEPPNVNCLGEYISDSNHFRKSVYMRDLLGNSIDIT